MSDSTCADGNLDDAAVAFASCNMYVCESACQPPIVAMTTGTTRAPSIELAYASCFRISSA